MTSPVNAQNDERFEIRSLELTAYRDGLVHLEHDLFVNEIYPEITLHLLSDSVENVIILDENNTAVDYEIVGENITIFTLGAENILFEYDTPTLTGKDAEVWTLDFYNPYNSSLMLPENATLIYLSGMPVSIDTQNDRIMLQLASGSWEISYIIPIIAPNDTTSIPTDSGEPHGVTDSDNLVYYIIAAISVGMIILAGTMFYLRRRGPNVEKIFKNYPQLQKEDREVIRFLAEKGGKAFEAEIREQFPDLPRTSLWRLVRRLERLEIVEIQKIGLENQVKLK